MSAEGCGSKTNRSLRPDEYCGIARHLLDAFGEAVKKVIALHEQQFQAVMEGDSDAGRFDVLIHEANEDKQNAKYAYLNHLHLHGCSSTDDGNIDTGRT
jgi:hypothetical protein